MENLTKEETDNIEELEKQLTQLKDELVKITNEVSALIADNRAKAEYLKKLLAMKNEN